MSVPPQNGEPVLLSRAAIQGHSPGSAAWPPTIRVGSSEAEGTPHPGPETDQETKSEGRLETDQGKTKGTLG